MITIGSHLSVSAGYAAMAEKMAGDYKGNTYAFFLRNPRGGKMKAPEEADLERMQEIRRANAFGPMVAHAPYTMNPCSAREDIRDLARQMMAEDLAQMERMAALSPGRANLLQLPSGKPHRPGCGDGNPGDRGDFKPGPGS